MWSLFRLLFAFALLFKTLTAFSLESPADRRVLVLLDDLALESSHSVFFNSLRSRDFELDIKLADDPNLALQRYGEYLYDALLLFSPSSERFGGSVNQAAVIDFIDSGRDLIMAADTNASDLIRNIASEYGVDFDKDAGAMVMDPTSYADSATEGDHTLIASDAFVKFDVILGNNKIEAPVLFQGIGHSINPKYGLLLGGLEVLSASPSAYSANPKSKLLRAPSLTGSAISFVSVVLARNKGRTLITGSLSMFSNKFFSSAVLKTGSPKKYEKSGNEQFLTELSKWVFHERGNLKAVNVKHNKVGEVDERAMYRINDDLEYSFEIFEWSGKSWEPYVADDVQVQFYMMSRYISKTLSTDKKGRYYTSFKVPDVYGVFNFKVEYQRIGYTSVSLRKQIAVAAQVDGNRKVTNIGVIVDENSRIGREERLAIELAVQDFNRISKSHHLSLHIENPGADPLEAASTAKKLIEEKEAKAIIGMHTWSQAAAVSGVGSQAQVPILSLAAPAITPPSASYLWPFLIPMAKNGSEVTRCVAAMVQSYKWKRIIAVYEDDAYDNGSGMLTLLSEALQEVGSEIEHRVSLPPFSSSIVSKEVVQGELQKVMSKQSRVFVVLPTSLHMVTCLFREAKQMGLVGRDSVWIITDSVSNFLHSFNYSVISSMRGSLGIQTYYSENTRAYQEFYGRFKKLFRSYFPDELNIEPGIYALLAYDGIGTIIKALERETNITRSPKEWLNDILSSNFNGLSGRISFEAGNLYETPLFRIVNVLKRFYIKLAFWTPGNGFSKDYEMRFNKEKINSISGIVDSVFWPGPLVERIPKGWVMPSDANPLLIVVPGRTSFAKFVKVESNEDLDGFFVDIFREVEKYLGYALPHNIVPLNGTYDDLVTCVSNKMCDAVIGEITILAKRMESVQLTQPYAESGLSLIVAVKVKESTWMFMRPFSWEMWIATGAILIYTMLIVWFLEHQSNPEFAGPWKQQLGTVIWFTFCTLFFAHREKIYSNFTKVVFAKWLFAVFILTSSYIASLSSMLTVQQLDPNVTDIVWLGRNNQKVGCDGSVVRKYLEEVLEFNPRNIVNISSEYDYHRELQSGHIAAAFLELPYARVFMNKYLKEYTAPNPTYRFGGLGFMFQKGSPLAADFFEAILKLSENGRLNRLEKKWFATSPECSNSMNKN